MNVVNGRNVPVATAGLAGVLVTLPFALLELATRNPELPRSNFPMLLFLVMWIFTGIFFYLVLSAVRTVREGQVRARLLTFGLKIVVAGLIAWNWIYLVVDQMPCFLGATGC